MNVVIFYTSREREFQNACLLKSELNKRGHNVYIIDSFYLHTVNKTLNFIPDVILTPYLYTQDQFNLFRNIHKQKIPRIINLQYEQILNKNHIKNNLQIPFEKMKNAIHICWSEKWRKKLIENGINKENAILTGSLNIDMCRERFLDVYADKEYLSKKYNLDINKKWIIFISSFVFADMSKNWKEFHYNSSFWGKEKTDERCSVDTNSRNIILEWTKKYINENECEFIYRPHPSEEINNKLYNIEKSIDNFHIIRSESIRTWIKNSEKIHTWNSTSITEVYFMGKNCSILRPIELLDSMNNEILETGKFTKTYEEFCYFNNNNIKDFPVNKNLILEEFYIDDKEYAYEKICNLVEKIVDENLVMDLY